LVDQRVRHVVHLLFGFAGARSHQLVEPDDCRQTSQHANGLESADRELEQSRDQRFSCRPSSDRVADVTRQRSFQSSDRYRVFADVSGGFSLDGCPRAHVPRLGNGRDPESIGRLLGLLAGGGQVIKRLGGFGRVVVFDPDCEFCEVNHSVGGLR
jgi:hypothetical protein